MYFFIFSFLSSLFAPFVENLSLLCFTLSLFFHQLSLLVGRC